MEYIFTNLPQYIRVTSRTEFSSSVVHSGSVLLFSEDGATLTAKLPDGSFITVGGSGSGTDVSSTTAEASDVLSGKIFYTSGGIQTSGTIPTVTASIVSGAVVIPSGYIASSQSFPVSSGGVNFSSVTATTATVINGALFYDSNGELAEGNMPFTLGETITPTTSSQTVSSGMYLFGDIVVEGDATLVASNIVSGVSIFGVSGTYTGSGGGNSTDFYRCTSVTSGGSTWTGYKAVLSGGSYSFESSVTSSGLSYGAGFTPVVGKIYDAGALVQVDRLYEGADPSLIFYAPLTSSAAAAATGQTMVESGTVTYYQSIDGIPCAHFGRNARLTVTDMTGLPVNGADNTIAGWFRFDYLNNFNMLFGYGDEYGIRGYGYNAQIVWNQDGTESIESYINEDTWYHIAATWNGSDCIMYLNGSAVSSSSVSQTFGPGRPLTIGAMDRSGNGMGYVADLRVYNRALNASEVADLAAKFTPTQSQLPPEANE